jgi:ubiquinone/menaquinone biosynthesis C-methylase UbiE
MYRVDLDGFDALQVRTASGSECVDVAAGSGAVAWLVLNGDQAKAVESS